MLEALRFVQGAVAKKDYLPSLTHFKIANGTVLGFNGTLGLCSPIPLDLEVTPRAVPFMKAIQTCKETISMSIVEGRRISIKSGKFQVFVECADDEEYPAVVPSGQFIELDGSFMASLKKLAPFIGDDASRQWSGGILFRGPSAYATNNIILVEYWLGYHFPVEVNIPRMAVAELIRINEEPERLQVAQDSITFHYANGRWLRTQTYATDWPDVVHNILNSPGSPLPVPPGLFDALDEIAPFLGEDNRIYLSNAGLATSTAERQGAVIKIEGFEHETCFALKYLQMLRKTATHIDFSLYPKPCLFYGDKTRGVILGMRS